MDVIKDISQTLIGMFTLDLIGGSYLSTNNTSNLTKHVNSKDTWDVILGILNRVIC